MNKNIFLARRWIRRKYERKEFLCPLNNQSTTSDQLEAAIRSGDIRRVFQILSQLNGNATPLNEFKFNGSQRCTALQLAASTSNIAITQLIIWCSGNINVNGLDAQGQNALAYAKTKEMKEFLKSQGCTENKSTPLAAPLGRSPNNSIVNKSYQRDTNFTFRDKGSSQMSNLVTSDFDQLPTSII